MTQALARADDSQLAVVGRDPADLAPRFVVSLDELGAQLRQLEQFKRDIMVEGVDYGTIPGTPKPTLLKPGAEKLSLAFALAPTFESANRIEDWSGGFFHYEERCVLTNKRTGDVAASANGSANSKEPRYRWRNAQPTCPECGKNLRRSKLREGDRGPAGWYCWKNEARGADGCGANFSADAIRGDFGKIENPEPYELTNTILKMAQKRALVAAVLIATGGSGIWTQDVEDMPSVTNDERVIDVTPAPRPAQARRETPPETLDQVTSNNDPTWKAWLAAKADCDRYGIRAASRTLPHNRETMRDATAKMIEAVKSKVDALAEQDEERKAQAAKHDQQIEKVKSARAPIMQELAGLIEAAAAGDIDVTPYFVALPAPLSEIRAKIVALQAAIDSETGD